VLVALVLVVVIRGMATLASSNWIWGFDAFAHWPPALAAAGWLLAAACLVPPIARALQRAAASMGGAWEGSRWAGDLLVAISIAVLLDTLRLPVRFTGDSGVRLGVIGMSDPGALTRLMYPLDYALNLWLPQALIATGWGAENALQLAGALAGGVFSLVVCRVLRAAGARGAVLPASFSVACGGALLVHFAGYDKFGPLMVGISLAVLGCLRLGRGEGGAWVLAAGVAVATWSHRSGLLLVPGAALLLFRAWRADPSPRSRRAILAASLLTALAVAALLPTTFRLVTGFDATTHLPGSAVSRARGEAEVPFVIFKLTNLLNVISFLVPLWIVGAVAALPSRGPLPTPAAPDRVASGVREAAGRRGSREGGGRLDRDSIGLGLPVLLTAAGFAALLLLVEPGGGWARDWDVATGAGVVAALAAAIALAKAFRPGAGSGLEGAVVAIGLVISTSIWGLEVNEAIALHRIESLAAAHPRWSAATRGWMYDFWGTHLLNRGDPQRAVELFRASIQVAGPNPRLFYQIGLAHRAAGNWAAAESAFAEAARRNPAMLGSWQGLAEAAHAAGDSAAARAAEDSIAARGALVPPAAPSPAPSH
jgi:hypothetical protein